MRHIWLLLAVLTVGFAAWPHGQSPSITLAVDGAPLTIALTARQVAALQAAVAAVNANERNGLPPWTVNQWLRSLVLDRAQSALAAHRAAEARTACDIFAALPPADQALVTTTLQGKSPCAQ